MTHPTLHSISTLTTQLSDFDHKSLESIAQILKVNFTKSQSLPHFDIFTAPQIEIRLSKSESQKKLLIITFDPITNITPKDILSLYPKSQPLVHSLNDPTYQSFIITTSWGKFSFGFDHQDHFTTLVFDST